MMHHNIIPIVVDAHGHHAKTAPTHSHINVARFENVKHLAKYLIKLSNNDTLYNRYFWWKPYFKIESRYPEIANRALCTLCEKLHSDKSVSIYHDLKANWSQSTQCHGPKYKGVRMFFGIFK